MRRASIKNGRVSVCLSATCLSRRSTAAAAAGGFAAEVGRRQQISIDSCCCRATFGPHKCWCDCKEVQHTCLFNHSLCFDQETRKRSPYWITERRIPELIPVVGSQPAGDVSHKRGCRLPLLSVRPVVTPATLKRAAANFAAW